MSFDKGDIELHLRLLNKWKVGNPSKPDQFYAFGTLWTDAEVRILLFPSRLLRFVCGHPFATQFCPSVTYQGTFIEANSHRVFTDILADKLNIGDVYILTRFTLDMPRKAFRTCSSHGYWLFRHQVLVGWSVLLLLRFRLLRLS
ncbi:hypothetical protein LINPERPRIM_LOCUS39116 [Linum perenne]